MDRNELLNELYYVRDIFERAESLSNERQNWEHSFKGNIPDEKPQDYIAYKPLKKNFLYKEKKKIGGAKSIALALGVFFTYIIIAFGEIIFSFGISYSLTRPIAHAIMKAIISSTGNHDLYGYVGDIQLLLLLIIGVTLALCSTKIVNFFIESHNRSKLQHIKQIDISNQKTNQENMQIKAQNDLIARRNANLPNVNREIAQKNMQINAYNQNIRSQIAQTDGKITALRNEVSLFLNKGTFPCDDFYPAAVEFYIKEVENLRCDTIKECANAYAAYLSDQENKRAMAQMLENQHEQMLLQREQLRQQKIGNILQLGNILATLENTNAINNMNDSVTGAIHQQTQAVSDGLNNVRNTVAGGNKILHEMKEKM